MSTISAMKAFAWFMKKRGDGIRLYHAEENLGYLMGPGSHGLPLVSREAIYQWMIR